MPRPHAWSVALLLLGCRTGPQPPEVAPEPDPPPTEVPPPVVRIADTRDVDPLELGPADAWAPLQPMDAVPMPADGRTAYEAQRPKSVVELQPWRTERLLDDGVTVTDLHPRFHRALLLDVRGQTYHVENRAPRTVLIDLERSDATGLAVIHVGDDSMSRCAPWVGSPSPLEQARASGSPYVSICDDHLLVRNTVQGRRSTLEWATDFVRSNVVGGEHLTSLVKQASQDRFRKDAAIDEGGDVVEAAVGPVPVQLTPESAHATLSRKDMALPVDAPEQVPAGAWLEVTGHPGVYVALIAPRLAALPDDEVNRSRVASADPAEGGALAMLLAFDLAAFELEFEVGTEHPAVGWSARAATSQVDRTLPGPDGIGDLAPLGLAAQVPPLEAVRLEASFTGGFKREHGAFREGELAERNQGSHYGFVQDGLILSKLQPGLATLAVFAPNHRVEITTWTEERDEELERVLHARQNGVALIRREGDAGVVTPLISNWRQGNWSGSASGDTRTIRAGACVQESDRGRYLIYGYFTAATPKAMARVFLAAGCVDAMHLDMNALEHTYAAVYDRGPDGSWKVNHLDRGMAVLDKGRKGVGVLPRFVAFADNRDFFTVLRR